MRVVGYIYLVFISVVFMPIIVEISIKNGSEKKGQKSCEFLKRTFHPCAGKMLVFSVKFHV